MKRRNFLKMLGLGSLSAPVIASACTIKQERPKENPKTITVGFSEPVWDAASGDDASITFYATNEQGGGANKIRYYMAEGDLPEGLTLDVDGMVTGRLK